MPSNPSTLLEAAKCFQCSGASLAELLKLALLDTIAEGGGVTCQNLEGVSDDPTGVETPTFIGQTYEGPNSVWKSTGLTSADWTEICNDATSTILSIPDSTLDGFTISASNYTGIEFPNLTSTSAAIWDGNFALPGNLSLASISLPLLVSVDGYLIINSSPLLTTIALPSLTTVGGGQLSFDSNAGLTSVSLPVLDSVSGNILFDADVLLPSISLPALTVVTGNITAPGCTVLTTFSAPSWVVTDGSTVDFNGCALNAASVNHILARCVAAAVTTCTIDLSGGTNAAPTGQGIADKAALILAGNTVTTN